jgi:hypothetical protein
MRKYATLVKMEGSYLLGDHLGSTSITTNASGALVAEIRYKPWGEARQTNGPTPTKYPFARRGSSRHLHHTPVTARQGRCAFGAVQAVSPRRAPSPNGVSTPERGVGARPRRRFDR